MYKNRILQPRFMQMTEQLLQQMMIQSIAKYASFIDYYIRLLNYIPNDDHGFYIQHIISSEVLVLNNLEYIYIKYFGSLPVFNTESIGFSNYHEGLSEAIKIEMQEIRFNRDMLISLAEEEQYIDIRETYRLNLTEHLEHLPLVVMLFDQTFSYIAPS